MIYLILYGTLLMLALADMLKPFNKKQANTIMIVLITIFTLFRGLRWNTGTDWKPYFYIFNEASISNVFLFSRDNGGEFLEPGFVLLNTIFNSVFPYTIFLLVTNAFILWAYYYTVNCFLSKRCLFAFCFLLLSTAFFPVRQEIANSIIMIAIPFLIKKNYIKFVILSVFAISIHKSAFFILLLIVLLRFIKLSPFLLVVFYISSFVMSISFVQTIISVLSPLVLAYNAGYKGNLEYYSNAIAENNVGIGITSIMMSFSLILFGCFVKKKSQTLRNNHTYDMLLKMMTVYFSLNMLLGSIGLTLFIRMTKYLFFADTFVLAYIANYSKEFYPHFRKYSLTIFGITLIVGSLSVNRFINKCNHYPELMFPYLSIFNDEKRNDTPIEFEFTKLLR